jgi:muconolactone delta-isomerase
MKEFLVELRTTFPEDMDPAEINRLRAAEAERAKELAAAGHLVRLWRPIGEMRSIGLWRAADEAELRGGIRSHGLWLGPALVMLAVGLYRIAHDSRRRRPL